MDIRSEHDAIVVEFERPFAEEWNRVPGVNVDHRQVTIDPALYFFRYENPVWRICDWELVAHELLSMDESSDEALEQLALDYIKRNSKITTDASEVLRTAEKVYGYIFRDEYVHEPDLASMGVKTSHLGMLREMGTMMALNRVDENGHPSNVGPAWFFPVCSEKVYDLGPGEAEFLDGLYHGMFFNEARRVESVKAHAALGGRLVHGCQSEPCMAGGCVVPYGASIARFTEELGGFKDEWMDVIRGY